MEIKSAEEIFSNNWCRDESGSSIEEIALLSMKEYAKQFIDLAAEKANTKHGYFSDGSTAEFRIVDKESILKVKQLIK